MDDKKIIKPLSMQRREFIENLENLVNCGLDLYLVEPILAEMHGTVCKALVQREQADAVAYQNLIKEQKEE